MPDEFAGEGEADKEALQRRMDETRREISETVAEIKSVVARQYEDVRERVETVREGVGEALDWGERFERNPLVWGAGAVSVGILIGMGLARALEREEDGDRGVVGQLVGELTSLGDAVLPTISTKLKEFFGLDLDAYLKDTDKRRALSREAGKRDEKAKARTAKKRAAKKGGARREAKASAARKRATAKTTTVKRTTKKATAKKATAKRRSGKGARALPEEAD